MELVKFSIEGVRCFADRQELRIRPLTFLVGENSTGKTTSLGCFQALSNCLTGKRGVDFNLSPYEMGNFENIIGTKSRNDTFKLGFTFKTKSDEVEHIVEFAGKEDSVDPIVKQLITKFSDGQIIIAIDSKNDHSGRDTEDQHVKFSVDADTKTNTYRVNFGGVDLPLPILFTIIKDLLKEKPDDNVSSLKRYLEKKLDSASVSWLQPSSPSLFALSTAPVRSRPKRTHDPIRETYDADGSDVPTLLKRMQEAKPKEWKKMQKMLNDFGRSSQLFDELKIKKFGKSMSDPFQVFASIDGAEVNTIDVGYGISQVLPILFRILEPVAIDYKGDDLLSFLLQQPEVHLHPKAQAELTTLLVSLAEQKRRTFIVETHSSHMLDRARIEITRGKISRDDVSLIYLEPQCSDKGRTVKAHNITFDEEANLVGEPPHYAKFFVKETGCLLGFDKE